MTEILRFNASDDNIHDFAAAILLGKADSEFILNQGNFAYQVKGGNSGYLYYKKLSGGKWILVAIWCFYGLYIVVRYRKPVWLRPMYQNLFAKMNFISIKFLDNSIELLGSDGRILKSRKFRLSPPSAFDEVMTKQFGYSEQQIESLKVKTGLG